MVLPGHTKIGTPHTLMGQVITVPRRVNGAIRTLKLENLDAWNELAINEKGYPLPMGGRNVNGIIKIKTSGIKCKWRYQNSEISRGIGLKFLYGEGPVK